MLKFECVESWENYGEVGKFRKRVKEEMEWNDTWQHDGISKYSTTNKENIPPKSESALMRMFQIGFGKLKFAYITLNLMLILELSIFI